MKKKWIFLSDGLNKNEVSKTARDMKISQVMSVLLLNRGITDEKCADFLEGGCRLLHDAFALPDMHEAVKRINEALAREEKITVYGDYDVDGISSVAMLIKYLRSKGGVCESYIPDREDEGYGLNISAIDTIKEDGTKLIITVDNGITAIKEVLHAKQQGIDMIITDHHACSEELPAAPAVVNAKRNDSKYPFKELSGAGVAFKLICALEENAEKALEDYSEYVSMATIADVVSLTDENRFLARAGIQKMKNTPIAWVDALLEASCIDKQSLASHHIGFMLAPRINAAGRMGSAGAALSLLMCEDFDRARTLANRLNDENNRRKDIGNRIYLEAVDIIEKNSLYDKKVIVLAGESWHQGIIGIIASRIADTYHKNVFLISLDGGIGKGSARGIKGFNLYEALSACSELLIKFGGHDMAAGLSINEENIPELDKRLNEYADKTLGEEEMVANIDIDCRLSCEGSLINLCNEMTRLEPFGTGNTKPVFGVMNALVRSVKKTKDEKHLLMRFAKSGKEFSAIGFSMGPAADALCAGDQISIAAHLEKNEYMGRVQPQFHLIDILQ